MTSRELTSRDLRIVASGLWFSAGVVAGATVLAVYIGVRSPSSSVLPDKIEWCGSVSPDGYELRWPVRPEGYCDGSDSVKALEYFVQRHGGWRKETP